jgi:clan AA aspartic protease (TIGR02281 family)
MFRVACAIVSVSAAALAPAHARADIAGAATVIDGDTIEIGRAKIRLYGIDAPELGQTCVAESQWRCGEQAARALDKKIAGEAVACAERGRNPEGLVVAVCRARGEDLGAWLVSEGWALAYRQHAAEYVDAELAARAAHRGVWRGSILAPWDWRVAEQAKARASRHALAERVAAPQPAPRGVDSGPRTVTIRAANDGHFYVDASANATSLRLVVDTGATFVSLARRDAERIGIDVHRLQFNQQMQTANGIARAARVTLREVRVASISVANVEAIVSEGRSEHSLLGLSFLGRLQSYSVSGKTLTLAAEP